MGGLKKQLMGLTKIYVMMIGGFEKGGKVEPPMAFSAVVCENRRKQIEIL